MNAVISLVNFPEYEKGKNINLRITFEFSNLLTEKYQLDYEADIVFDEDSPNSYVYVFDYYLQI